MSEAVILFIVMVLGWEITTIGFGCEIDALRNRVRDLDSKCE